MSTKLITENLWSTLTTAIRDSKRPCHVAVAYFGQEAANLLPLPCGSHLVVDASERSVKQGMTCPAELLKLQKKGVKVFSVKNLHAKVYVVGKSTFVGSANVSRHSAGTLIETLLQTTESEAVADARQFVVGLCLDSLGPERLKELSAIYRPPLLPGGKKVKQVVQTKTVTPELADLYLAQFKTNAPWPDNEEDLRSKGMKAASNVREHTSHTHKVKELRWDGHCRFEKGLQMIQIITESGGVSWVYPPGFVLHVRKHPGKAVRYIYVEYPNRRRKRLSALASKLGRGAKSKLLRTGKVKDLAFTHALLGAWHS